MINRIVNLTFFTILLNSFYNSIKDSYNSIKENEVFLQFY
jgi:hypothetical protein